MLQTVNLYNWDWYKLKKSDQKFWNILSLVSQTEY